MTLKPCPFCGEHPVAGFEAGFYTIQCRNEKCAVTVCVADANDYPIEKWDTRAEETAKKTAHWDINMDGYYPFCSHCGEAALKMSPHCPNCGRKMVTRGHDDETD